MSIFSQTQIGALSTKDILVQFTEQQVFENNKYN